MIYINTKTGAVLETDCTVCGGDWQPKETDKQPPKPKKKSTKEA